jgi:elongator complex protein 3
MSSRALAPLVKDLLNGRIASKDDLHRAKIELCRQGLLPSPPSDAEILAAIGPAIRSRVLPVLRTKASRTASGVAVVAAMTAPYACPHGRCVYCPGGPAWGTPQSYLGTEPAAMRGAQHGYDPYRQTRARVDQLHAIGHATDKVDFIILGGTFTNFPAAYQESFAKGCYDGLNGFESPTLAEAMHSNETAANRMIGLTIETKPERFGPSDVAHAMSLGVTRVEFGVQSAFDDVLARVNRGHTVQDVRDATRRAKDAGLKVCYHMMPGLPGSDAEKDLASFRTIFEDPDFRPDMLKIYPTLVLPGTGLHELWRRGEYEPLSTDEVVERVAAAKEIVPPWVRILRIQREIGVPEVAAGLAAGNVRELARARLAAEGKRCRCIRCREVGLRRRAFRDPEVRFDRQAYEASGGREEFLSLAVDEDTLVGYARLRGCGGRAVLRELKVFGTVVPLDGEPSAEWQHRGFGARLLEECERIAGDEWGLSKFLVTSGIGVREYYRRHGARTGRAVHMEGPHVAIPLR